MSNTNLASIPDERTVRDTTRNHSGEMRGKATAVDAPLPPESEKQLFIHRFKLPDDKPPKSI
jgi:hypothetical protein